MRRIAVLFALWTVMASASDLVPVDRDAAMKARGYWQTNGRWYTHDGNPLALSDSQAAAWGFRTVICDD